MDDLSGEIDDIRLDIQTLRTMIDARLDNGADGEDLLLRASANVLYERRARLDQLERAAGFEGEGRDKQFSWRGSLTAMPERLDPVTFALDGSDLGIPWRDRQALMRRLEHVKAHSRIRSTFDAVDATRRVGLTNVQRYKLLYALDEWSLALAVLR